MFRNTIRYGKWALAALVIAILAMTLGHGGAADTQAADENAKTQMDIVINNGQCDSSVDAKCTLPLDSVFTVSIVPSTIPVGGYMRWGTLLDYGSLLYKPAAFLGTEIKWDQTIASTRGPSFPTGKEGQIRHQSLSAFDAPFPVSTQKTSFVNLTFNCARNAGGAFSQLIKLVNLNETTGGAMYVESDGSTVNVPNVGSLEINCGKQPKPGDTDGDGCADVHESGLDETQGGLRDWTDPNDYYDVYGPNSSLTLDGVIDLPNDILGVIQHFAPSVGGAPPYDVRFDRGQTLPGQNHWKRAAPDGVIDLPNDILGVILQFQHNCV